MKKYLSIIFFVFLLSFSFYGCGPEIYELSEIMDKVYFGVWQQSPNNTEIWFCYPETNPVQAECLYVFKENNYAQFSFLLKKNYKITSISLTVQAESDCKLCLNVYTDFNKQNIIHVDLIANTPKTVEIGIEKFRSDRLTISNDCTNERNYDVKWLPKIEKITVN